MPIKMFLVEVFKFQSFSYSRNNGSSSIAFAKRKEWDDECLAFAEALAYVVTPISNRTTLSISNDIPHDNDPTSSSFIIDQSNAENVANLQPEITPVTESSVTSSTPDTLGMTVPTTAIEPVLLTATTTETASLLPPQPLHSSTQLNLDRSTPAPVPSESSSKKSQSPLIPDLVCPKKPLIWIGDLNWSVPITPALTSCINFSAYKDVDLTHPDWFK